LAAFVADHTRVVRVPLCPEILLRVVDDLNVVWREQEARFGLGHPPPYWAMAWPGGQALARYVLDHAEIVRRARVLDFGAGCAIGAIAAAKAGAHQVEVNDPDPFARTAARLNAALNRVGLDCSGGEDLIGEPPRWDVVLAGDLWYDALLGRRVTAWLRQIANHGCRVFLGDVGRAHFPRSGVKELFCYEIPASPDLEQTAQVKTFVWRLSA
jgi:predicted nicotinamide N-methyase